MDNESDLEFWYTCKALSKANCLQQKQNVIENNVKQGEFINGLQSTSKQLSKHEKTFKQIHNYLNSTNNNENSKALLEIKH